jgi:hypothetical protein
MITTKKNGKKLISHDLLDCDSFKFAYTEQLFFELGLEESEGVQPLRGDDPWYLQGELHGVLVSATFNTHENLTLNISDRRISYNTSMKETLNNFIEVYREKWHEHHECIN